MLSEHEGRTLAEAVHYAQDRGLERVTVSTEQLFVLLVQHDILNDDIVLERRAAAMREHATTPALPAGQPARPPVLDSLTEDVAVTVTLDDLVEAVSRVKVHQAAAWTLNPWFTPESGAA